MATLAVLGQAAPPLSTDTTLFTATAETVVSTIVAANRSNAAARFSIAVVPSGDTLGDKHWIYRQLLCGPNDSFAATAGWTLATGDTVVVRTSGLMSFSAFGEVGS